LKIEVRDYLEKLLKVCRVCVRVHWTEYKGRSISKTTKRIRGNRFKLQTVKFGCIQMISV